MYGKRGSDNATSKPVMEVYNKRIYESASECSELTGLQLSKICAVCRGDRGSTGGRVFRYIDTDGQIIEPNNPKQQVRKRVINTQTGEIFDNVDCATISMGRKCGSGLSKALKDGKGICYMFDVVWCYEGVDDLEILNYEITPKPPKPYEILSKQVKNIDTGEIFNSIAEGSRSINCSKSTLSKKLKEGNGECTLKNNKWILL